MIPNAQSVKYAKQIYKKSISYKSKLRLKNTINSIDSSPNLDSSPKLRKLINKQFDFRNIAAVSSNFNLVSKN